jgi:hypothetical protein
MKNKVEKKKTITVTLDPNMIVMIDDKTINRSNLINWLLKEHFGKIGEDVSKIKL